jgi:hypothetical protein
MSQLQFESMGFFRSFHSFAFPRLLLALSVFGSVTASGAVAAESVATGTSTVLSVPADRLSAIQLTAILKENEQKSGAKASRVVGSGPRVTVMAQESSDTASDRQMKIDAVFFAKTLIESAPQQIEKVDVIFSGARSEDSKVIVIDKKSIKAYGEGNISPEEFLKTLHLTPVNTDELPALEPGPLLERRLLINERIEKLRKTGTGVKPFLSIFQSIESAIKGGDTARLSADLQDLEDKLTEQEEQVAIAKRTARGQGLTPVPGKSTPGTSSGTTPRDEKVAFDKLKEMYVGKSGFIVQRAQSTPGGQKLADLKRRIDERLAKGQNGDARPLIEEFIKTEGEMYRSQNLNRRQNDFSGNKAADFKGRNNGNNLNVNNKNRSAQW